MNAPSSTSPTTPMTSSVDHLSIKRYQDEEYTTEDERL